MEAHNKRVSKRTAGIFVASPEHIPAMDHRQHRIVLLVLAALSALGPFSVDMYLPGFPAIAKSLNTDIAHVALSLTSYFIGMAVGQIAYGPVMDRYGRRRPRFRPPYTS
jgi:MFS family permease